MSATAAERSREPVEPRREGLRLRRMFRVTWRQHRLTLIGLAALLGGCAAILLAETLAMRSSWSSLGLNHCSFPLHSQAGPCGNHLDTFANLPYRSADLAMVLHVAPALIGMFAGAPLLAREFETGTFQYTLAQGITPARWAAGKLAALSSVIAVAALGVGVAFTWWYGLAQWTMTQTAPGGWGSGTFGLFAVAFAGWAVLAFNLGALAGAAIQRTVPAMAAFLGVFAPLAIVVPWQFRPRLIGLAPVIAPSRPFAATPVDNLVLGRWFTGPGGHRLPAAASAKLTARLSGLKPAVANHWLTRHHYTYWTSYQPHSRFLAFQMGEGILLLALSLAAAAITIWCLRRRAPGTSRGHSRRA